MEIDRSNTRYCSFYKDKAMTLFKCIFRNCFEDNETNNDGLVSINSRHMMVPTIPGSHHMGRMASSSSSSPEYNAPASDSPLHDDAQYQTEAPPSSQSSLFSRLRANLSLHQSKEAIARFLPLSTLRSVSFGTDGNISSNDSSPQDLIRRLKSGFIPNTKGVLKEADTFAYDVNKEVPTIYQNEFILPGSDIQNKMAMAMKLNLEDQVDECVICMDIFCHDNPRMPTLCGCGENKTYFHLPCLYQWIEKNRNCPACRKLLRWEEF